MNSFSRTMARVVARAALLPVSRDGYVRPPAPKGRLLHILFRARFNTQLPPLPRQA